MGLPAALKAHKDGNSKLACQHYQRALEQKDHKPVLFQNYGALLREQGELKRAAEIYQHGLSLFPNNRGILSNFANLLRSTRPISALDIYIKLLAEKFAQNESITTNDYRSLLDILDQNLLHSWSFAVCAFLIKTTSITPCLLIYFYKACIAQNISATVDQNQLEYLENLMEVTVSDLPILEQAEYHYALSWVYTQRSDFVTAKKLFFKGRKTLVKLSSFGKEDAETAQNLNNINSWNLSCALLSHQDFESGWPLFEYGLRAGSNSPQKWQRAMPKPFTHYEINIWRGENLRNKRLLVLEEQAVGDVMQFITLIPDLLQEASHVSILMSDRLIPIYKRSFQSSIDKGSLSIVSFADVANNKVDPREFDYQTAIGSICAHRFLNVSDYSKHTPILISNSSLTLQLRCDIQKSSTKKIIGISWKGGGTPSRMSEKSVSPDSFISLFDDFDDFLLVDLQYGDTTKTIQQWKERGVSVYHNDKINPLKNMDDWLCLVDACDAVLSVANTTIHGAGGLHKPTMCLLSQKHDWRWFSDPQVMRSYWYSSVGIARQSTNNSWDDAFSTVKEWFRNGCPHPLGPASTTTR
jgi:tetratricopeptide (TPR) repeat protein